MEFDLEIEEEIKWDLMTRYSFTGKEMKKRST